MKIKFETRTPFQNSSYFNSKSISLSGNTGNKPITLSGNIEENNSSNPRLCQLEQMNERLYNLERILLAVAEHFGFEAFTEDGSGKLELKPTKPINYMKAKKALNE